MVLTFYRNMRRTRQGSPYGGRRKDMARRSRSYSRSYSRSPRKFCFEFCCAGSMCLLQQCSLFMFMHSYSETHPSTVRARLLIIIHINYPIRLHDCQLISTTSYLVCFSFKQFIFFVLHHVWKKSTVF